jgi:flagellar biosynthetic protein FliP
MSERTAETIISAKRSIRKNLLILFIAFLFLIPAAVSNNALSVFADDPPAVTQAYDNESGEQTQVLGDNLGAEAAQGNGQGTAQGNGQGTAQITAEQETAEAGNGGLGETLGDNPELSELFDALNITADTTTIDLIILITILTIAPSLLIMLTCFTRIIIAFSLLRNAMGIAQTPPNQIMLGLALFLTFFIMSPVFTQMNEVAYVPYKAGEISSTEALTAASRPLKVWMLQNTSNESMDFFLSLSKQDELTVGLDEEQFTEQVKFTTVVPAFILSEIKIGFQIGFLLYVPFLIIDIVVATVLMSMGMMMLPPTTVSIPFKILLFVLVDGWTMLIQSLVVGFNSA